MRRTIVGTSIAGLVLAILGCSGSAPIAVPTPVPSKTVPGHPPVKSSSTPNFAPLSAKDAGALPEPTNCDSSYFKFLCTEIENEEPNLEILADLAGKSDLNCYCTVTYKARKLGSYIPIIKDTMRNKYRTWDEEETPLSRVTTLNRPSLVTFVLDHGGHPDRANPDGSVPLSAALSLDSLNLAKTLLEAGANAHLADLGVSENLDHIAFMMSQGGNGQSININFALQDPKKLDQLLQYGPDLSKVDPEFLLRSGDLKLTRRLFDQGMPPDIKDSFGKPFLHLAVEQGRHEYVDLLLAKGANVNGTDTFGGYPIAAAVESGDPNMVVKLVEKGASISQVGSFDRTPLESAVREGNPDMVIAVIDLGGNPNQKDSWGEHILEIAIEEDNLTVIRALVENGSSFNKKGQNPFQLAQEKGASEATQEYLRSRFQ
ncbi:MAG: hypothetical protein HN348_02940 [Proteobacteria bacterium]|jgi:ankyrin repeat protein|nr:hypothetical protein [Pseudomonadota bacterium]